jgi:hypothetical protein
MLLTAPRDLRLLNDEELVASIATLTGRARHETAALVAHLAEMERRGLHHAMGFKSLYGYCRAILHLSEHESYNRMEAAGVALRFPVVLPMLAEGLLHLTAVSLLGPHLRDENHLALLGGSIHKSKREVEARLAGWFPKAEEAPSVRKLPASQSDLLTFADGGAAVEVDTAERSLASATAAASTKGDSAVTSGTAPTTKMASRRATPPRKAEVKPVTADRYQVKFTASEAMIERLREAQELLSHSVPNGDLAQIFDQALIALLEKAARRKHAATSRPGRPRTPKPTSRAIPAGVEREVWARDGGRCAFVGRTGLRCEERRFIEFHHVKPWITGGPPTAENIALRCQTHNAYEAAVYFGPIRSARVEAAAREAVSPDANGNGHSFRNELAAGG